MFKLPLLAANASSEFNVSDVDNVVNGVSEISKAISENGPVIVICSVFIVLFILVFLLFLKFNNTMFNNIISQINQKNNENSEFNKKILDHYLKEIEKDDDTDDKKKEEKEEVHKKDLVGLFIDYNTTFKKESQIVLNNIHCDRVALYVFHNGNKALYGLPFIKMSCVFDTGVTGNMTIRHDAHTNLPLHLFNDLIESLYRDGEFAGSLDDNVETHDNSIRQFLAFSNARSLFMRAIKKEDGSLAGFTVCEFSESVDFSNEEFYNKVKYSLRDMNTAIRYIVTNEQFSKKLENHEEE